MASEGQAQNGGGASPGPWGGGEGEEHGLPRGDGFALEPEKLRRRLESSSREILTLVRRYPLESLAGALVLGFFAGRLVSRRF